MKICELCGKPIRYNESQTDIPVYNEQDVCVGVKCFHLHCGLKMENETKVKTVEQQEN